MESSPQWLYAWPIPFLATGYLIHLRYRQLKPRRLPTLTSLRKAEIYGLLALLWPVLVESEYLKRRAYMDRDLCAIHVAAKLYHNGTAELGTMPDLRNRLKVDQAFRDTLHEFHREHALYPKEDASGFLAKVLWWYNHAWSDYVVWSAAFGNVLYVAPAQHNVSKPEFSAREWDIIATHIANTMQGADGVPCTFDPYRFITACGIVTPISIAARLLCSPYIFIPLNIAQRILLYSASTITIARRYQHYRYPTTLHDMKGMARYLCRIIPQLAENVEIVMAKGMLSYDL
ncbi:hypothetical protein BV20DRAFT_973883 [Pilatotrama ljubarskyi]|nr:hypothetical protein BV20DRAFT_973883 [Pilatotrama ljubarskyi]